MSFYSIPVIQILGLPWKTHDMESYSPYYQIYHDFIHAQDKKLDKYLTQLYQSNKNNYYKVLNEFKGITDQPGNVWRERLYWYPSSEDRWKGINDTVWESGAEYSHYSGQRMLKIASKVVSPGTHDDLSFNYRGGYDANTWPMPAYYNNTGVSNYMWFLNDHNWTYAHELYVDLGTQVNANIVMDLAKTQTFTHVSITPRMDDTGSALGAGLKGVQIWGSNDNSTYTLLYGPTDDVKRYGKPQSDGVPWFMQMCHY